LYAHWLTINFRESYDMYACSGILFNHESPLRGTEFVTRKITTGFAAITAGQEECIELGNLDARRDWGFAGDYVEAMALMLQQERAEDYVIAPAMMHSIRSFAEKAAAVIGVNLTWEGAAAEEIGRDSHTGKVWVRVNPAFYRPAEVDQLLGDATKAHTML